MNDINIINQRLKQIATEKNEVSNTIKILENQNIILSNQKDLIREKATDFIRNLALKYFAVGALATIASMIVTYFLDTCLDAFTMYETIRKFLFVPGITGIALMINSYPLAARKWPKTYDKDTTLLNDEILENEKQIKENKNRLNNYYLIEDELESMLNLKEDDFEDNPTYSFINDFDYQKKL